MSNTTDPITIVANPPKTETFIGELLSAEPITEGVVLLTLQGLEDDTLSVSTSSNYWKKLGKLFPEGSIVKCSYEKRVGNKTTYTDSQGNVNFHKSDGNNLVGINRFSQSAWERNLQEKQKEGDLAVISAVEADRVAAVAQYLSSYIRK